MISKRRRDRLLGPIAETPLNFFKIYLPSRPPWGNRGELDGVSAKVGGGAPSVFFRRGEPTGQSALRGLPRRADRQGIQGGMPPWSRREALTPREKGRQRAAAFLRRALEGGNAKRVPPPRRLVPQGPGAIPAPIGTLINRETCLGKRKFEKIMTQC